MRRQKRHHLLRGGYPHAATNLGATERTNGAGITQQRFPLHPQSQAGGKGTVKSVAGTGGVNGLNRESG